MIHLLWNGLKEPVKYKINVNCEVIISATHTQHWLLVGLLYTPINLCGSTSAKYYSSYVMLGRCMSLVSTKC